jgi:hypothetical protein
MLTLYKDGFLRLQLPIQIPSLHIWDVNNPPEPDRYEIGYTAIMELDWWRSYWLRYFTADLNQISGITFFCSGPLLLGIHVHDSPTSSAFSTYKRIRGHEVDELVWKYVPRAPKDRVTMIAKMTSLGMLVSG